MNEFLKVFCEENWLQLADHIITILFGVASFILAIIAIILTKRDKAKTIAINELQAQTKKLEELYLYQVQPRFVVKIEEKRRKFVNVGGDCYDLVVKTNGKLTHEDLPKHFPAKSENLFNVIDEETTFEFKDVLGNSYTQTYYNKTSNFTNPKKY